MPETRYLYVDSNVFISYFNNHSGRATIIEQLFDEVERSPDRKLITSALTIVEVANLAIEKARNKLIPDFEQRLDDLWQNRALIEFVDFHEILARQARTLMRLAVWLFHWDVRLNQQTLSNLRPPRQSMLQNFSHMMIWASTHL